MPETPGVEKKEIQPTTPDNPQSHSNPIPTPPPEQPTQEEVPEELKPLNNKQESFCQEYLKDRNSTQAAIRAGYSAKSAKQDASQILTYTNVKHRINQLIKEQLDKIKIDANFIIRELLNSATVDINDAYDEDGNLKPISEIPEPLRKAITEIRTEELFEGQGKNRERIGTAKTVKFRDGLRALELLGKHLKMFADVIDLHGMDQLAERIAQAEAKRKAKK